MSDPEITVDLAAARRLSRALQRAPIEIRRGLIAALRTAAKDVATETRALLRRGGSDVPNPRSGLLARSIRYRKARGLQFLVFANQPTGAPYGKFFETSLEKPRFTAGKRGRQARGVLRQRPFLTRALEQRRQQIGVDIGAAVDRALREAMERTG